MVRSALRTAERNWASRIVERLGPSATAALLNLIAVGEGHEGDDESDEAASLLSLIRGPVRAA